MKGPSVSFLARYARIAVITMLLLYPFSHVPLLPVIGVSPFQFFAIGVALFGAAGTAWWLMRVREAPHFLKPFQAFFLLALLASWLLLSFLWGSRSSHELYYIGLFFIGLFFAIGMFMLLKHSKLPLSLLVKVIIIVGVVLSLGAIWQFTGESMGLDRDYTSICPTCLQHDIGFARPSGFSQEPEHFSTVLLAPLILSLTLLLGSWLTQKQRRLLWLGVVCMLLAFLLAASRSGLLALLGVLVAFSVFALWQHSRGYFVKLWVACVATLGVALLCVAGSGTVGDEAGIAYTAERYIAHTSGGLIVVGKEQDRLKAVESTVRQKEDVKKQSGADSFNYITEGAGQGPSGAIAYSAQSRLETYRMALSIWGENGKNFILGVGWGNFGVVAAQREPAAFTKNTIVNNQYLQIAVELGLVGAMLFVVCIIRFSQVVYKSASNSKLRLAIFTLFGAYGVQLLFYSGLHLLQFWLSAAVVAYILVGYDKKVRGKKAVQTHA